MTPALMAYYLLRLCGQESFREDNGNLEKHAFHRKKAQRRRLRTVMQDLIYMASRIRCPFLTILRGKHIECHGFRQYLKAGKSAHRCICRY